MKAWLNEDGSVRETCADPQATFHADVAANFTTDVPDGTLPGAKLVRGAWVNPPAPPAPEPPAAPTTTIISKTVLKERLGIKAMLAIRTSTDEVTKVILGDFIDNDPNGTIDVSAPMAQGVVGYWAGLEDLGTGKLTGAGTPYIDPAQVAAILAPHPI